MDKVVDVFLNSNVGATRLMGNPKKWSGRQMEQPVKVSGNTTFETFSGFDTFSTAATDNRQKAAFDPKFGKVTVSLPLTEIAVNKTSEQVINLLSVELGTSVQDLADQMGTQFYGNGGGTNFSGLGLIVDDGSVSATYGGLTRASFSPVWQSTVTSSSGTLSLAKIATLYDAVSSGSQVPTVALTTKAVFSLYESLLEPQARIMKPVELVKGKRHYGAGAMTLDYRGVPILADEKATAGEFIFLNEDYIDWYGLTMPMAKSMSLKTPDVEGNDYNTTSDTGFSWSDWTKATNAAAITSFIYSAGDFWTSNPKRHGKLTAITGV